jgi:hypothetical protein
MKVKNLLSGIMGRHIMRHRHHKRMLHNALVVGMRQFGPGKGLLVLSALAAAGVGMYMQRRHQAHASEQLPEVGSTY